MKHTPGPWINKSFRYSWQIISEQYGQICLMLYNEYLEGENEANAKLIASAPQLLESLNSAYQYFSKFNFIWEGRETSEGQMLLSHMRHAIKKATE